MKEFCPKVGLDIAQSIEKEAKNIVTKYYENRPSSRRRPSSVACGALYYVCKSHDYPITQRQIAKVSKTEDYTIRHAYRDIVETLYPWKRFW
jgi:transcription initiation factor TFIIIB Brf1 subunit/transcription initiation factor TFIIB